MASWDEVPGLPTAPPPPLPVASTHAPPPIPPPPLPTMPPPSLPPPTVPPPFASFHPAPPKPPAKPQHIPLELSHSLRAVDQAARPREVDIVEEARGEDEEDDDEVTMQMKPGVGAGGVGHRAHGVMRTYNELTDVTPSFLPSAGGVPEPRDLPGWSTREVVPLVVAWRKELARFDGISWSEIRELRDISAFAQPPLGLLVFMEGVPEKGLPPVCLGASAVRASLLECHTALAGVPMKKRAFLLKPRSQLQPLMDQSRALLRESVRFTMAIVEALWEITTPAPEIVGNSRLVNLEPDITIGKMGQDGGEEALLQDLSKLLEQCRSVAQERATQWPPATEGLQDAECGLHLVSLLRRVDMETAQQVGLTKQMRNIRREAPSLISALRNLPKEHGTSCLSPARSIRRARRASTRANFRFHTLLTALLCHLVENTLKAPKDAIFSDARTVEVGGSRGSCRTIQEAIRRAKPGDRIVVHRGRYVESVTVDKAVDIVGQGGDVVIEAKDTNVITWKAKGGGSVRNLTLRVTGKMAPVYVMNIVSGRVTVEGCDITSLSVAACLCIHKGAVPYIVRNTIHDSKSAGIVLMGMARGTIELNDIHHNQRAGIEVTGGAHPRVARNHIHENQSAGIYVCDTGRGVFEKNEIYGNALCNVEIRGGNPEMTGNRIFNGLSGGVYIYEGGTGVLEQNEIASNAKANVEIRSEGNPRLIGNKIHHGRDAGVLVHEGGRGTVEDCHIFGNKEAGIEVRTTGDPTVSRCRVESKREHAIFVYEQAKGTFLENDVRGGRIVVEVRNSSSPTFTGNTIHDGKTIGVLFHERSRGVFQKNTIRDNTHANVAIRTESDPLLIENILRGGQGNGVYVCEGGRGQLKLNEISRARRAGVEIRSGGCPTLISNTIHSCTGAGVFAYEEGTHAELEQNTIQGNQLAGVDVITGARIVLRRNVLSRNARGDTSKQSGGEIVV